MAGILIVEDDEANRSSMLELLQAEHYEVEAVTCAEEALDRLAVWPRPALLLLDLNMPGMDGRTLLGTLNSEADFDRLPIVVVTALDIEALYGADAVLNKPFAAEQLLDQVARYCLKQEMKDEAKNDCVMGG